ncbi:MAG TPA: metalloregulator ArsR/SmtB family transcription factor [Candidatus Deferrimicrobium sp.]|nr:metalloregulator ArsR/SmtB family transcription factor [Candidatus Deferrimicrobium sp.]
MDARKCCAQDPEAKQAWEEELERQLDSIPSEERIDGIYDILHALSHPIRIKIAFLLLKRDQCVCELVQLLGKAPNLISHHLAIMRRNNIVKTYMKSKDKYYKLNENISPVLAGLEKIIR